MSARAQLAELLERLAELEAAAAAEEEAERLAAEQAAAEAAAAEQARIEALRSAADDSAADLRERAVAASASVKGAVGDVAALASQHLAAVLSVEVAPELFTVRGADAEITLGGVPLRVIVRVSECELWLRHPSAGPLYTPTLARLGAALTEWPLR